MKLNVGLNKKVGRKIIHKNVKVILDGYFSSSQKTTSRIFREIKQLYPEWSITGWTNALAQKPRKTKASDDFDVEWRGM